MKSSVFVSSWRVVLLASAVLAVAAAAQAPTSAPSPAVQQPPDALQSAEAKPVPPRRVYPPPMNLKVLPENLTGEQVHEIMEQWAGELGVHCNACHLEDRFNTNPNGRPRLDFMDDSKGMKLTARLMFTMTEQINSNYIAKVDGSGMPVTCGTCHRGQVTPEPIKFQPPVNPPNAQLSPSGGEGPRAQ